jgi:microcystin degradation protein MlrC
MRFAMLGVSHETNTFSSRATTYAHFERSGILSGDEIRRRYRESQATQAGFFDAGARLGVEVVPLVFAITEPMGTITADAFDRIVGEMLERLWTGGPWEGVLLGQHGAAVSERHLDMDGEVTARVRAVVGPHVPVGLALDMHANVSPRMVARRWRATSPRRSRRSGARLRRRAVRWC